MTLPPLDLVGHHIGGDFKVLKLLATGGIGAVYEAEQRSTGRKRALKVMHGRLLLDERMRERFLDEARSASTIYSDHVVEIVSAGVDDELRLPWIAMELLRGCTLQERQDRLGPASLEDTLEVFSQLRHGLQMAHARGLVHRDLKPDNLFIAEARRQGVPFTLKVLDFGIAKWAREEDARNSQVIGTPLWMAPEQLEAGGGISPATDVWALGLIAFWMLTGRLYWLAASRENAPLGAILVEMVTGAQVAPSERVAQLNERRSLPRGFDGWFLRCIDRDPSRRFHDVEACVLALHEVLSPSDTIPAPDPGWEAFGPDTVPVLASPMTEAEALSALARNPRNATALRVALEARLRRGDTDSAWWTAQAATTTLSGAEGAAFARHARSRTAPRPVARPLAPGGVDALWAGPAALAPLSRLCSLLGRAALRPLAPQTPLPRATIPDRLQEPVRHAALVLGHREPTSLAAVSGDAPCYSLLSARPWVFGVNEGLLRQTSTPRIRFLAAWRVAWCLGSLAAGGILGSAEQLEQARKAALAFSRNRISATPHFRAIVAALGPHRAELDQAVSEAEALPLAPWWAAAERTAARAALLCAADLEAAREALDDLKPQLASPPDEIHDDLCRFALSDDFSGFWYHGR